MRMVPAVLLSAMLLLLAPLAHAQDPPPGFREEFLGQFDSSMSKLIALSEAMPADRYAWSPGAGVMPVARVYAHIARYNYLYPANNLGVAAPAGVEMETMEQVRDKAQVVEMLRQSGDHVRRVVREMSDSELGRTTRLYGRDVGEWAVLLQLLAHMNEHLGQSVAYARINGVVPPWSR